MIETVKIGKLHWSHLIRPSEEDLRALQSHYNFHPLDIEDCRSEENLRPKVDVYDDYLFLILHFPSFNESDTFVETREFKIFWGKDFLITIGKSHWLIKNLFNAEQTRNQDKAYLEGVSSDDLFYRIVEYLMDDTKKLVDRVDKNVDDCGKALFDRNPERIIEKISITRKNVILLNTMFRPQLSLFNKFQSGVIRGFSEKMEDYWGNITDDYQRVWDTVEDDGELISGYSKTFDSLQVNKTNEVMKILTLVSSILLPLTFIASLYGMNIKLPGQEHSNSFIFLSLAMGVIAVGMVVYFKIRKWM
jgi:magnesium transporter